MEKKKGNIYLKAGIWSIVAEILVRAVSFLSTPVFTRILPIDVYGEVKTFESWLSILAPVLSLGLYTNIEIAQYRYQDRFKRYVSSVLVLIVLIHSGVFIFAMLFRDALCALLGFTPWMLMIAVFYSCFYSCILCVMRVQRITLNYRMTTALSLMATVPAVLISVAACLQAPEGISATEFLDLRVISFYLPIILLGIGVTVFFVARQRSFVNGDYWKYALQSSIPLIMYQISLQILTQSDRVMVKSMVSAEKAAIFSIGTTVIYIVEILHKGFESAWIPWLYKQLNDGFFENVKKAIYLILAGFGLLFFFTILLGREVILVLGGTEYLEAVWLLGPMLGGVIFQFLMLKLADIEKFYNKGSYVGAISIVISVLNLALNYLGIRFFGYQAAAYTTMLSYIVAVVIHLALISKSVKEFQLPGFRLVVEAAVIAAGSIVWMRIYTVPTAARYAVFLAAVVLLCIAAAGMWKRYGDTIRQRL